MSIVYKDRGADYYLEIAKGNIPKHSLFVIRGHSPDIDSAEEDVAESGNLTYLTSAERMNIASTSTDDIADGDGVTAIKIEGVDNDGAKISESVVMDGTDNVLTNQSYLRVNQMVALTAGDTGWNAGIITATAQTAGTVQCQMNATESISQNSHYTVPLNHTFYIVQAEFNAAKTSTGGNLPVVEFKVYARRGGAGAAWVQFFDKRFDTAVTDELDVFLPFPANQPTSRTDLRVRALTDKDNTEVRVRMYGILVDNS